MSQPEIISKLHRLLVSHLPFTEESQVLYLLVEIRKVLDRENNKKYPILRFYCDWSVHTEKDRITPEMRSIMEEIYTDIFSAITNPSALIGKQSKIIGFMYMEDLQEELQTFLQEYGLPDEWISDKDNWLSLVILLVSILADQPINKPTVDIRQFSFHPAAAGCVNGIVIFSNKIDVFDHYEFGNAY